MSIELIVACGENGEIGKDNKLLWKLKNDLKRFKEITSGHTVVMGWNTFESIGKKPLPNRSNIVVTSKAPLIENTFDDNLIFVHNPNTILPLAKKGKVFIIGGQQIYEHFYEYVSTIHLTLVHAVFPKADKHFISMRHISENSSVFKGARTWHIVDRTSNLKDEKHEYNYTYLTLQRS